MNKEERRLPTYPNNRRKYYPVLWHGINFDQLKSSLFLISFLQIALIIGFSKVLPGLPEIIASISIVLFFLFIGLGMICDGCLTVYRKQLPMGLFSVWGKPAVVQGVLMIILGTGAILFIFWFVIAKFLGLPPLG